MSGPGILAPPDYSATTITISTAAGVMLIFHPDGRLEAGSGLKLDDAATREIFDTLERVFPAWFHGVRK